MPVTLCFIKDKHKVMEHKTLWVVCTQTLSSPVLHQFLLTWK